MTVRADESVASSPDRDVEPVKVHGGEPKTIGVIGNGGRRSRSPTKRLQKSKKATGKRSHHERNSRDRGNIRAVSAADRERQPSAKGQDAQPGCQNNGFGQDSDDDFGEINAILETSKTRNETQKVQDGAYEGFAETIREMETFYDAGDQAGAKISDAFVSIFSSSLSRWPNDKAHTSP